METPIGMEQGGVERTSQQEQNIGQVAPPTQLGPDELGLGKNELHHLAQDGRQGGRAAGETLPSAFQATLFLFGGRGWFLADGFGIESGLDFGDGDGPVREEMIWEDTDRATAKDAEKAENGLQGRRPVATAMAMVMAMTVNRMMRINGARRMGCGEGGRTDLHVLPKRIGREDSRRK